MVTQKKGYNKEELISLLVRAVSEAGLDIDDFSENGKTDLNKMINCLKEAEYLTIQNADEIEAIFH